MKVKLLKRLRHEALSNLDFVGGWSGYWTTTIGGTIYKSNTVSGFKYVIGDTGTFIQDSIISHCKKIRNNKN